MSDSEDERERYYQQTIDIVNIYSDALKRGDEQAQTRCLQLLGKIKLWETEEYIHQRLSRLVATMKKVF